MRSIRQEEMNWLFLFILCHIIIKRQHPDDLKHLLENFQRNILNNARVSNHLQRETQS